MTERPKTPRGTIQGRPKLSYRALEEYFRGRAKRMRSKTDRERLVATAEHYRKMAKVQEEAEEAEERRALRG